MAVAQSEKEGAASTVRWVADGGITAGKDDAEPREKGIEEEEGASKGREEEAMQEQMEDEEKRQQEEKQKLWPTLAATVAAFCPDRVDEVTATILRKPLAEVKALIDEVCPEGGNRKSK